MGTGTILVLLVILTAELMVRQGFAPLRALGGAASGDLVLK